MIPQRELNRNGLEMIHPMSSQQSTILLAFFFLGATLDIVPPVALTSAKVGRVPIGCCSHPDQALIRYALSDHLPFLPPLHGLICFG